MTALRRSWMVLGLWLTSSLLAILFPTEIVNGHDLFLNLSYLFGSLLMISYLWARFSLLGLRVTRRVHTLRTYVGHYAEEIITVENYSVLPKLYVEVRDYSDLPFHRASRVLSGLAGRSQRSWMVRTPCYQRGRFRIGPLVLCAGDPFGLFLFQREIGLTSVLTVYPFTAELPGFSPPTAEREGNVWQRRHTYDVTINAASVREYVPGDSFNRIHWPSSARLGRLIVKEFERDALAEVWLVLDMEQRAHIARQTDEGDRVDLSPPSHVPPENPGITLLMPATQEYAVASAASLARHFLLERNWPLGLVTYAYGQRRTFVPPDYGARQLDRVLSLLAVLQPMGGVSLAQVLEMENAYLTRNALLLIITSSVYDPQWVAAVQHPVWRGGRAMVVLIDPVSFLSESAAIGATEAVSLALQERGVPCSIVRRGDHLSDALRFSRVDILFR
ncbi:MAG: DUF58 domain-containing protein [Anaerolineae bacterium]|nr:DUF58 domain-containing protein [Anaerolineae bacterium]MDW8071149.1 DUF58 domain-containing protein [Anaerolineae bacterium]